MNEPPSSGGDLDIEAQFDAMVDNVLASPERSDLDPRLKQDPDFMAALDGLNNLLGDATHLSADLSHDQVYEKAAELFKTAIEKLLAAETQSRR